MAKLSPPSCRPLVIIASNDKVYAENLGDELEMCGMEVRLFRLQAFVLATNHSPFAVDVVLVETHELEQGGWDLLEEIREAAPLVEVVAISSLPAIRESVCAMRTGVFAVLQYPVTGADLERTIVEACKRKRRAEKRIKKLNHDAHWFDGGHWKDGA